MNHDWANIAECLRGEIAEYGTLLNLIEDQHRLIFKRDPAANVRLNPTLQAQVEILHQCRGRREQAARDFAAALGQPSARTMRALLPLVAAEGRPLMAALIAEINHLVHRVRRALALNQRLLACSVDCQQEFMRRLWPSAFTKTYAADGRVSVTRLRRVPSMQTAG
jgi:flagellar biosynthesis/type III secretory pathway chaperone